MKRALTAFAVVFHYILHHGYCQSVYFDILTTWDNQTIDHLSEPARVSFVRNSGSEFRINVEGKFYNSPLLPPDVSDAQNGSYQCPQRSGKHGTAFYL